TTRITLSFPGTGSGNTTVETFDVTCDAPAMTFQETDFTDRDGNDLCSVDDDDWAQSCNEQGYLGLKCAVSRTCRVEKREGGGAAETVLKRDLRWVGDLKIKAIGTDGAACDDGAETVSVEDGRSVVETHAQRSRRCTTYRLEAHDVDGRRIPSLVQ